MSSNNVVWWAIFYIVWFYTQRRESACVSVYESCECVEVLWCATIITIR